MPYPNRTKTDGVEVACPKRGIMAAMRCQEYQLRDLCGLSCGAKAPDHVLINLHSIRKTESLAQQMRTKEELSGTPA